jgi:hypothetical protein
MSKIYIGSPKRGDSGMEASMSGIIVIFTSLDNVGSWIPAGGTSYNM